MCMRRRHCLGKSILNGLPLTYRFAYSWVSDASAYSARCFYASRIHALKWLRLQLHKFKALTVTLAAGLVRFGDKTEHFVTNLNKPSETDLGKEAPLQSKLSNAANSLVFFAAARAGVTQRSPSPRGEGERCVTPAPGAAKKTTNRLFRFRFFIIMHYLQHL